MREVTTATGTFKTHAPDIPDWLEIRHFYDHEGERYNAYDRGSLVGEFKFTRDPDLIRSRGLGVAREYQRRGVASALLERFRVDNPDARVEIWVTTEMGAAFIRKALEREPEVRAALPTYVERSVGY